MAIPFAAFSPHHARRYYNERTVPFNISVGFTQPVDGVTASIFRTTACTIQAVYMQQPKTVFVLSVQPNADSSGSGGLSNFMNLFLPTDAVDQGNNAAFFSSQYSPNADARVQASISAPSYYIASQKTVTANVVFERGPINSADYTPLSTSSLSLTGGTVTDVTPRCTFGQCLNYDVELTPRATGTMRLFVQQDALGANSNAATRGDAIQFDGSGTNIDGATLEYTGATSYGPTTTQIFGNIRITPPVDANNVSESILQLSTSGIKLGSFQAFESSFGTPNTLVRFTLFPTTDENFTISVAEDVFAPPGNKNFSQLIRFDPNAGGGGTPGGGGDRPIRFALQGPSSYSESNALDIPLTLQVFLSAQQQQNIGNPLKALNGNNFRVTGGNIGRTWLGDTWPAEDFDSTSYTYFFNVTAQPGDGGRYPSVQVELEFFPNATFQRGPIEFIRYTSESPIVQVGIEGPAFYTVGNDSANNPVPRPLYVTVRLSAPISRPDLFLPSTMTITGG